MTAIDDFEDEDDLEPTPAEAIRTFRDAWDADRGTGAAIRAGIADIPYLTTGHLTGILDERDGDLCVMAAFLMPGSRPIEHWLAILANHFGGRAQELMDDPERFAAARNRLDGAPATGKGTS